MIGIHAIAAAFALQFVKQRRSVLDSFRRVDVATLRKIEIGQQVWRHATVERRSQVKHAATELLQQFPSVTVIEYRLRQPVESLQPPERSVLGIVIKEVPMAMALGHQAGQDSGNRTRTEAQHSLQRSPI